MRTKDTESPFGRAVAAVITKEKLDKKDVADEAGVHYTTLYRTIDGDGISKPKVLAVIRSVNRLAGRTALEPKAALELAGFEYDEVLDSEYLSGGTPSMRTIAKIIDAVAQLPLEKQRDVLAIVEALAQRNK